MNAEATGPLRPCKGGIEVFVRLTPRSSGDTLDGVATTGDGRSHIRARVRAVPEKGAANAALEKLLARSLGVLVSSVTVISGTSSRLKTVRITGDPTALAEAVLAGRDGCA